MCFVQWACLLAASVWKIILKIVISLYCRNSENVLNVYLVETTVQNSTAFEIFTVGFVCVYFVIYKLRKRVLLYCKVVAHFVYIFMKLTGLDQLK